MPVATAYASSYTYIKYNSQLQYKRGRFHEVTSVVKGRSFSNRKYEVTETGSEDKDVNSRITLYPTVYQHGCSS